MPGLGVNKFDNAATDYDDVFSRSRIGLAQRSRVWHFMKPELDTKAPLNILELNCGTGEDALFFARHGHMVSATDISEAMLKIARSKDVTYAINFFQIDLNNIDQYEHKAPYDLIFSNFGGINCINEESLRRLLQRVAHLLSPGGTMVAVIMPSFCLWETFYFLLRMKLGEAFRRKKMAVASVSGTLVETWYYTPRKLRKLLPDNLKIINVRPVGFFIPPSYLESFIARNLSFFNVLVKLEWMLGNFQWQAALSDHCLIKLEKQ